MRSGARSAFAVLVLLGCLAPTCEPGVGDDAPRAIAARAGRDLFASPQADPIVLGPEGRLLFVANTTSHSVSVIDTETRRETRQIPVGLEPVSLALRPDGAELWVSNHVSDSVSVIDLRPESATLFEVIATIQDVDELGVTRFDEPAGIAFASSAKAYVALSSRNRIAIVDIDGPSYTVRSESILITAQDPRAIRVRDGRLYVIPFESMNQTELSACPEADDSTAPQCTISFTAALKFAGRPNLPDEVKNIVVDPDVPDRDLFVFDTDDESPVGSPVSAVGTLLYGLAVDGRGRVFVTQTEALNAVNGDEGQNLIDLGNRMFLNQITRVDCGAGSCGTPKRIDLEPRLPTPTDRQRTLATPYGIAISDDDSTLVATASGTSRVFAMNPDTGRIIGRAEVGAIPRGLALYSDPNSGAAKTAYVLNTLDNSVSVVELRSRRTGRLGMRVVDTIPVGDDPTPDEVRLGRIVFNDALASTSGTFSCGSCHPDGHTDQLLWRIGGACFFDDSDPFLGGDCSGNDEPRLTQPIRGLRNTLPLHWDGSLGDPIGGVNGSTGSVELPPDCSTEHECFRHLVNASLSGVMCDQDPECAVGETGLPGLLGDERREHLASFLGSVSYPPARSRRMDDTTSGQALDGFRDFFMEQGGNRAEATCAESFLGCHDLPLGTTTNSFLLGFFDSVTLRGMTDRFVQFSNGITATEENLSVLATDEETGEVIWDPELGYDEFVTFAGAFGIIFGQNYMVGPNDLFQMFEEATTGTSGATGRQVTLSATSARSDDTARMLDWLEDADDRDAVDLRGSGRLDGRPVALSYLARRDTYLVKPLGGRAIGAPRALGRDALLDEAADGALLVTLTGELPRHFGEETHRQPLIAPFALESLFGVGPTGDPLLPHFPDPDAPEVAPLELEGIDIRRNVVLLLNGQPADGSVECVDGVFEPYCSSQEIRITLAEIPPKGTHLLQVQNPGGPHSNELPVCVGPAAAHLGEIVRCLP